MLLDINLCDSGPCQNNASCENFRTFYTCNCAAGFEGVNCQTGKNLVSVRLQPAGKTADISWSQHWFPRDMMSERNKQRNSILMMYHHPDLGSASDWFKICFIQSEANPDLISMEFLASFLRHHFAGKLEVASWNDGSFLRLVWRFQP